MYKRNKVQCLIKDNHSNASPIKVNTSGVYGAACGHYVPSGNSILYYGAAYVWHETSPCVLWCPYSSSTYMTPSLFIMFMYGPSKAHHLPRTPPPPTYGWCTLCFDVPRWRSTLCMVLPMPIICVDDTPLNMVLPMPILCLHDIPLNMVLPMP